MTLLYSLGGKIKYVGLSLIPHQIPSELLYVVLPYALLFVFIVAALVVGRFLASRTARVAGILRTRFDVSERMADLVSAVVRFTIWTATGLAVVTAILAQFGLGCAQQPHQIPEVQ